MLLQIYYQLFYINYVLIAECISFDYMQFVHYLIATSNQNFLTFTSD